MSAKKDERFKKDLLISVLGHFALISLIIIVNPAAGFFRSPPESLAIGMVDLGGGQGGAPAAKAEQIKPEEAKSIVPPPANDDVIQDESVEQRIEPEAADKMADIIPEKPQEKPKKKTKKKEETKPKQQQHKVQSRKTTENAQETKPKTVTQDGKTGVDVGASVASGEGTGGSGTYNLPYNIGLLTSRIERAWRNPVSAAKKISCTIYFQIGSDGLLIGDPVIERSSGIPVFDRAALMAVRRAGVFPAFPAGFDYEFIGLHLDFEYVP